ncbi:MAG: S-methyl-5'-thioadenosine phosphorylase [Deferribacterales bacterium]
MKIGIIGGTGLEKLKGFRFIKEIDIETKYGAPTDRFKEFEANGNRFYFLSRHGKNHEFPPHLVNYRGNIDGFKQLGVDFILAFSAVGGINKLFNPGDFVVLDDLIDFTNGRSSTFCENGDVYHIDFTTPFCPDIRKIVIDVLNKKSIKYHDRGVYVCTNGPRLETPAEIKMFEKFGADLVGMTVATEAVLAREAGICYAAVSIVSNYAAGISKTCLTTDEVVQAVKSAEKYIVETIEELSNLKTRKYTCGCREAIEHGRFK